MNLWKCSLVLFEPRNFEIWIKIMIRCTGSHFDVLEKDKKRSKVAVTLTFSLSCLLRLDSCLTWQKFTGRDARYGGANESFIVCKLGRSREAEKMKKRLAQEGQVGKSFVEIIHWSEQEGDSHGTAFRSSGPFTHNTEKENEMAGADKRQNPLALSEILFLILFSVPFSLCLSILSPS